MPAFKVAEVTCQTDSENRFGKVTSGYLTVQALALQHGSRDNDWHFQHDFEKLRLDFLDEGRDEDGQFSENHYKTWTLVLIGAGKNEQRPGTTDLVGLVLKPACITSSASVFERIGTFEAAIKDNGEMDRLAKAWTSPDLHIKSFTII